MTTCTCDDVDIFITQTPSEDLDYDLDWGPRFLALVDADTIATSEWILPTGLSSHGEDKTTTTTTVWITGGTAGTEYQVVNRVTTTQGRVKDQNIFVTITDQ